MSEKITIVEGPDGNDAHSMFIGRYQPFHAGHIKLMKTVLDEGKNIVIALRDTPVRDTDPYTVEERINMIQAKFPDATVYPRISRITICPIPDISEVVFGRGVGWGIRQIKLDEKTESISATKIREEQKVKEKNE
jgi:cytidyltransferase-like protein